SATDLFALLSNPSNLSLLASQILSAPAIWTSASHLETVVRVINVFTSASIRRIQRQSTVQYQGSLISQRNISTGDWVAAVISGIDGGESQSRQVLAFAGLLQGCSGQGQRGIPVGVHSKLQNSLVKAANLSLLNDSWRSSITDSGLVIAITVAFESLDRHAKNLLNHDLLLPMLISSVLSSESGLRQGYFLSTIDVDVAEGVGKKFHWSTSSQSYRQLLSVASGPLVTALGRLSRLAAYAIEQTKGQMVLQRLLQDLCEFARSLSIQWRQNKLSEIDASEERMFLSDETLRISLPLLWRVLRTSSFAIVVVLTACMGRLLSSDFKVKHDAPSSAILVLKTLRHISFITSRLRTDMLSHYSFVYLTAIDILSRCPKDAEQFLTEIQPFKSGQIPQHPLDRSMDLYFLNTAEHFAPVLDSKMAAELLILAASPYLNIDGDSRLIGLFEAAHSVMLAVLATPHNGELALSRVEPYFKFLFQAFPQLISPRQFRFAVKQLIQIASPPSFISRQQPILCSIILEVLYARFRNASSQPLPGSPIVENFGHGAPISEEGVLVLALIDSLPYLPLDILEDWLPIAVRCVHSIQEPTLQHTAIQRFWEVLTNGGMDVDRAALCVTWWGTRGGREILLYGTEAAGGEALISSVHNKGSKV
ncbi:MAG: hypothetical protein Q9170_000907, partial [Blastenia crenularia]